ncbi:MAG: hypothetical protein M3487_10915 [Actinomycetota bacterium]|nr:hypothetical protein [Acidimicrobiia bacterium]MDQ3470258.1 hypothetical protein [Actinomycetota bacterium]
MDPSPLPPHERSWRHPSELGAPAHEPTTTGGRILILSTATFSLLLVGLLAISMTPDRAGTPEAVSSTESGVRAIPVSALTRVSLPMVTPVGNEGMGLTTLDALGADARWINARLPSGEIVKGEVVATSGDLALVELPPAIGTEGLDLAEDDPTPDDTVMVHAAEPIVVSVADINTLDVDEGTPVTDAAGRLVGLCTGDDVIHLRIVASLPAATPQPVPTVAMTAAPASPTSLEPNEDAEGEHRNRRGGSLSGGDDGASDGPG